MLKFTQPRERPSPPKGMESRLQPAARAINKNLHFATKRPLTRSSPATAGERSVSTPPWINKANPRPSLRDRARKLPHSICHSFLCHSFVICAFVICHSLSAAPNPDPYPTARSKKGLQVQ